LPSTDTSVGFVLTATDSHGLSASVPVSLHAVSSSAPVVTGFNVKDSTGAVWVGNAGQNMTLNVLLNTADLNVTGSPTATVTINGNSYTANYTGVITDVNSSHGANQGVLTFSLLVPSGVDASSVALSGIANSAGGSIICLSTGVAFNTTFTALSAPYIIDNTAPGRPSVNLDAGLTVSNGNVSASSLTNAGGVLDVVTEPGASVSVLFTNPSNQTITKTVDAALLGINHVALTANEAASLGTGNITAQIVATDPAGNRSDTAWINFTVL
jgi:hypothetical protein